MFDQVTELDQYRMECKSLEGQLEEYWQYSLVNKDQIENLQGNINSLEIRNQELLEIVRKLAFVLEETTNHA